MEYVVLKNEKTGKMVKLGRFTENGLTEKFYGGKWIDDHILYSELFDGLLEEISEIEANKIIAQILKQEKIAA